MLARIRRVRPEYRKKGSWRLLLNSAPAHRSTLITDFFTKNDILTINHSQYSPDLALSDLYLFGKLHLVMKGKRYADIKYIQRSTTTILNIISTDEIKISLDSLLDRRKRYIESKGDNFK